MTDKRNIYQEYVLHKLGFVRDNFLQLYLAELTYAAQRFRFLGAIREEYTQQINTSTGDVDYVISNKSPYLEYESIENIYVPINYGLLDYLTKELTIKKNLDVKAKQINSNFISATDIASFTYCPISFVINKTFTINKIETAIIGTKLHEKHRLINWIDKNRTENSDITFEQKRLFETFNTNTKTFLNDINNSRLFFSGHSEDSERKVFRSFKGNFVGQPDYIFSNMNNQLFVVEEKFQLQNSNSSTDLEQKFYNNHINQLLSYLYGLPYEIAYGYLVYWKYEFESGKPIVKSCIIKKVCKSPQNLTTIREIYKQIKSLLLNKETTFDVNSRRATKCANCVSNIICGHKTGRFSSVEFPYKIDYLKTQYVKFPEELKKE